MGTLGSIVHKIYREYYFVLLITRHFLILSTQVFQTF